MGLAGWIVILWPQNNQAFMEQYYIVFLFFIFYFYSFFFFPIASEPAPAIQTLSTS